MMAKMMIEPTEDEITICDPACGSGRFFIHAQPLAREGPFTGIDRDRTRDRAQTARSQRRRRQLRPRQHAVG